VAARDVAEGVDADQDGEPVRDRDPHGAQRLGGLLLQDGADAEEDEPERPDQLREEIPRPLHHVPPLRPARAADR
jgi:hypothetical protein